ncbi:hypothetical protein UFOVP965_100 [uncultured Caudovirales phage]|uniref:Uncharacterized protein n=1 Tax=uncultured Caudovirales phage TaxID=2100421 RepID=A0A6J5PZZ5_9CAUD|nr:hypothetical protein UFOVP965_100 [uncultured Caudovirales phage]CAB4179881.1 hypothetical protein UFOVP1035_96 [uncultured Caudovirales phage]CAB4188700.1 hypothetical protein UFOVP1181_55 [uncultured Caudovirales phage]
MITNLGTIIGIGIVLFTAEPKNLLDGALIGVGLLLVGVAGYLDGWKAGERA